MGSPESPENPESLLQPPAIVSRVATIQIQILIGGLYAGSLFALLASYCQPELTKRIVDALGSALAPLSTLLVGIGIYVFYRVLVGELVLYPVRHAIHFLLDKYVRRRNKDPKGFISFICLLGDCGVDWGKRRFVYSEIRDSGKFLDKARRQRLDLIHSTYHLLYLTALEVGVAALYQRPADGWRTLLIVALIFLVGAYIADLRQDSWECWLLRRDMKGLNAFLQSLGFPGHLPKARATVPEPRSSR
jgi:hypothetical protein